MKLSQLFPVDSGAEVTGLALDSRKVRPGDVFFCLTGLESDGHAYAGKAAASGAVAIVHSKPLEEVPGVVYIPAEDVTAELNRASDLFFGSPSKKMTIFGVTGTNGKTTITMILRSLFSHVTPTGYIGTVGVEYNDVHRNASLTTPDQIELQSDLAEMAAAGMQAAAVEISSHGLVQRRAENIDVDCAVFTNLTRDHLDYHKTMEAYFEAKKMLFKGMKPDGIAVLNADDPTLEELMACCACPAVTYGKDPGRNADYQAEDVVLGPRFTTFTLRHGGREYPVRCNLIAGYNVSNLLAVIAAAHTQGMPLEQMIPLLNSIPQVPGRMEVVDEGQSYHVIADFAHTPDAFEKVFEFAQSVRDPEGKVYAVFGCTGRRDTGKRPIMGAIAGRYCDEIAATSDDPRDEDPAAIGAVILESAAQQGCPGVFRKRREDAIEYILQKAQPRDLVLLLGQGRQPYLIMADGYREPYDGDPETARKLIRKYFR